MGFFDRFRKPEPKPEPNKSVPLSPERREPPPFTPQYLASEASLPPRDLAESHEGPRTILFPQLLFGKLVQFEGGPIVNGFEHTIIGKSSDLNPELESLLFSSCVPKEAGLVSSVTDWKKHPWYNKGGIVFRKTILYKGQPYIVCAKVNGTSESGEADDRARDYTQAKMIAIPAKDWSISVIPQLDQLLDPRATTSRNDQMESLECSTKKLDESLPDGWFDLTVQDWIKQVLSGRPVSIQDWETSHQTSLQKIYFALLCLPESVAREISFGVGIPKMEGQFRMAKGVAAHTDVRKIGASWKQPAGIQPALAEEYLLQLKQRMTNVKTPREMMRAVETMPSEITRQVRKAIFGN